ncbi:MAG: HAMP domain-containing histidine kinase [Spirochaetia bacterium]|nr:HAMP domain-containing histidine kinase [Spirochaetia bacterium]
MKIKTQSFLLLAGIIIIPIVLVSSYWLMFHQRQKLGSDVPTYEEIFQERQNLTSAEDWERIRNFISRRPPNMEITVFDKATMEVLYSTMEQFVQGQKLDNRNLLQYSMDNSDRYFFQMTTPPHLKDSTLVTLIRSEKRARPLRSRTEYYVNTVTIISVVILLFCIVIITMITRSIAKSVTVLEDAAKRVTRGELDKPIEVRGSNEVISLTKSLNELRLAVKENRDKQARFIMGISHDLKTPLALIRGYVEALYDEIPASPEERRQYASIILKKADDLEGLINDLIDFIKVDTGEWRTTWQNVNLRSFVEDVAKRGSEAATILKHNFKSEVNLPDDAVVQMDEKLMNRCFENLFSNAIRYSKEGSTVVLRAFQSSGCYKIQIEDDGIGIDKDELKNIFDLFYRGTASRREKGSGLGLAIVKSIINSHNWGIGVESEAGKGTVFTITIPA